MKKKVYCPHCGIEVGEVDDKTHMVIPLRCHMCNLLVVYEGETKQIQTMKIPPRGDSSGKRFY